MTTGDAPPSGVIPLRADTEGAATGGAGAPPAPSSPPRDSAPRLTPDQTAAHQLLSDLRTRISTQPLPYQHGIEASALESLWLIFDLARDAMKKNPGCEKFAALTTDRLNTVLRPVTGKWHRAMTEGRLASKDGADEFRGDLEVVRRELRAFAAKLQEMAYRTTPAAADEEAPPALEQAELRECLEDVRFGIPTGRKDMAADAETHPAPRKQKVAPAVTAEINESEAEAAKGHRAPRKQKDVPADVTAEINESEAEAVAAHRKAHQQPGADVRTNAVGLALSGGGIRSATFALGVVQVLADKQLLEYVDFLSTVSGGGYTGSFLTSSLPAGAAKVAVGNPGGPDTVPVAALRANAKYLTSANLWESWSKVTATLAGMLLNWTAPLFVVLAAARAVVFVNPEKALDGVWPAAMSVAGALTLMALLLYAGLMRLGPRSTLVAGGSLAVTSVVTLAIALLWTLVVGRAEVASWFGERWRLSGAVAALLCAGPAIIFYIPVLRKPQARGVALKVLLLVAGLVIPILALAAFYGGWALGMETSVEIPPIGALPGVKVLTGLVVALGLIALLLINVNLTGPHRLYRDALARTFVGPTDPTLQNMNEPGAAPYHLINATVNLPSSGQITIRDRRGDFFLFSKKWCGSMSTGYYPTDQWKASGGPVDLKTAMAISGAAASPHMGLSSLPRLSALLTFLNVRLGFWIRNPRYGSRWPRWPGFWCLLREMLAIWMSETSGWLNLSDGGHIENTACYELLRRRCKFIIAVDGEADPTFRFGGLLTLVRHAQIDLGIGIDPRLDELRPDPKTGHSRRHAMLCRIHYPDAGPGYPEATGLLLYLKLSVTGNESELMRQYRAKHPDFPHQSTLDQFFDQEQFEAYRELGVHVAQGLFSPAVLADGTSGQPVTVKSWFERLARNLLDPKRS